MSFTFLSVDLRVARKEHRCIWCPEKILVGDRYQDVRCIYEGDFQANKYHPECKFACEEIARREGPFDFSEHQFKRGSTEER